MKSTTPLSARWICPTNKPDLSGAVRKRRTGTAKIFTLLLLPYLTTAKEAAIKHEFDVLLVFMFDRIGRIDDETPFVVEWFVKHGIEVWSVKEGEQRFDSHVDKLTNYIRFWQASGESEKTSMRIKTRKWSNTEISKKMAI